MNDFYRRTTLVLALCAVGPFVRAQSPPETPTSRTARAPVARERDIWAASSALLVVSVAFDERLRAIALANQSRRLDRLAAGADVLGTAGHIAPALVTTYVGARLFGQRSFADATLRVGLSYAAADAVESLLKPAVGRVRPNEGREPMTFQPFSASGNYQSFPSAHVVHIASLATAIAMEANRPWVTALAAVSTTYVGVQRVYRNQHWSSDVVASGMLGVEVARATMEWVRRRP
jgi:membrane-associated phospholipid phosphatase